MRKFLVALFVLLATPVGTQTHPCDDPLMLSGRATHAGWCHTLVDGTGQFNPAAIGFVLSIDGVKTNLGHLVPKMPSPNGAGAYYFEVALPVVKNGRYPVVVYAYDVNGVSATSNQVIWEVRGNKRPR